MCFPGNVNLSLPVHGFAFPSLVYVKSQKCQIFSPLTKLGTWCESELLLVSTDASVAPFPALAQI